MKPPIIDSIANDGTGLTATIEGIQTPLATFRESYIFQQKVYLIPPFTARCQPTVIQSNYLDEDSDLMEIDGCIHDPWAAGVMRDFAAGKLSLGTHRRI